MRRCREKLEDEKGLLAKGQAELRERVEESLKNTEMVEEASLLVTFRSEIQTIFCRWSAPSK